MNYIKIGLAAFVLALTIFFGSRIIHKTDDTEWQAVQYLNGQVEIKQKAGTYFALFPKVTDYPYNLQFGFTAEESEVCEGGKKAIRVTFNDGGSADLDTQLRVSLPATEEAKRAFHRQFAGNMDAVKQTVFAHLSNAIKATGPLMSASENQASRKSEFGAAVEAQMRDGLYDMRRVERELDQVDEKGNKVRVAATEIILDKSGKPVIAQASPLTKFGISVEQCSITKTEYDRQTLTQFETKKDAFLRAESAKAQREGEVQQRFLAEEKGRRELAEVTATSNKEKEQAVITAQKEKEVAELQAERQLQVALKTKERAETEARQKLEVAKTARLEAEEEGKRMLTLAQAEKERINLGGAISEKERMTLEVMRDRDIGVATALSKVNVPQVTIAGGGGASGTGGAAASQQDLINLFLLKQNGLLDPMRTSPTTNGSKSVTTNEH